jgi:hypothetical protein
MRLNRIAESQGQMAGDDPELSLMVSSHLADAPPQLHLTGVIALELNLKLELGSKCMPRAALCTRDLDCT